MIIDGEEEQVAPQQNNKEEDENIEMQFSENIEYSPKQFVMDFENNIDLDFKGS